MDVERLRSTLAQWAADQEVSLEQVRSRPDMHYAAEYEKGYAKALTKVIDLVDRLMAEAGTPPPASDSS